MAEDVQTTMDDGKSLPETSSSSSATSTSSSATVSNSISTNDAAQMLPKSINVNVAFSNDRWVVVSYQNEKGDQFHGILLNSNETNGSTNPSIVAAEEALRASLMTPTMATDSWRRSTSKRETWNSSSTGLSSPPPINGLMRSPDWDPGKLSAIVLRRTCSNGTTAKKDDDFALAISKPALGIRRLENRSVRLRPTVSQRNTVLCAKCQEQRVCIQPNRRTMPNGGNHLDRNRNGPVSLVSALSSSTVSLSSTSSSSNKRRPSDNLDTPASALSSSNGHHNNVSKKLKTRTGSAMAAEADQSTAAALPSASKVIPTSEIGGVEATSKASSTNNNNSADCAVGQRAPPEEKVLLKVPKLKISFGNNESGKTTTIIPLPPAEAAKLNVSDTDSGGDDKKYGDGSTTSGSVELGVSSTVPPPISGKKQHGETEGDVLPGGLRVGDVVWAKMPGSPFWPAKIYSANANAACVTWCGSNQYGFVDFKSMEPFKDAFRKRYNAKRNTGGYQKSVAEAIVKCSGNDVDSNDPESYYYQNVISSVCWKHLTGSRSASSKSRGKKRHGGKGGSSSGRRGGGGGSSGKSSKSSTTSKHTFRGVDGIDSESMTSVSSIHSPRSPSTTPSADWQPRVIIRVKDQVAVAKGRRKMMMAKPTKWSNFVDSDDTDKLPVFGNSAPKPTTTSSSTSSSSYHHPVNESVSPLPVQRSEHDEEEEEDEDEDDRDESEDDEEDDFKKLEIDETAQPDDDADDDEKVDGDSNNVDRASSSSTTVTVSNSPTDNSGGGETTYRSTVIPASATSTAAPSSTSTATSANITTVIKNQTVNVDGHAQVASTSATTNRPRVGESQDDFESALTELQEINDLCAGNSSVWAQC